ncbi:exo-beta-N-acetylmuramidase NamZ domain-containing protein [Victivallis sp. Marseille-Q1083]|uniref:exo-beta-N-acetylmuramidase NamZ family protein n=1 Tax=Victivallis sp. Marseille-Q1083 TaxID=2717288 RepID=UPI00158D81E7|nr:DUF1343 domain-containing protein [Victivallis sp. Marseille-Q1083]
MRSRLLALFFVILPLVVPAGVFAAAQPAFKSSLENFLASYTHLVAGKRVGLVTNPTGVDRNLQSVIDIMNADKRINLVALFAPEHGIRGNFQAGVEFNLLPDPQTGLPVYSLYGPQGHRPSPEALKNIDVLIYYIQDIGSRTYTYIWHMAECMSAAAEADKTMIILDVPNPFGPGQIDGPIREESFKSFIGLYPIPYTYALTAGELARYLKGEEKINCRLQIIPMGNYSRETSWEDTGLTWVPTSPQIPSAQSAYCYPITGVIGTMDSVNIGIGYTLPFQVLATPWIDADKMAAYLNDQKFAGVRFRPIHFRPLAGNYQGEDVHGVQIHVLDPTVLKPSTIGVAMLCYLQDNYSEFRWPTTEAGLHSFDLAMGTSRVRELILQRKSYQEICAEWEKPNAAFKQKSQKYRLYR